MFRDELAHLASIDRKRIVMPDGVKMRLNRLEKPEPWPQDLVEAIRAALPADLVQQYPAYQPFYERLAAFVGVPVDRIVVGAGIEEFIRMLMAASFGKKFVTLWPTCAMVDVYAAAFRVDLVRVVTQHPASPPSIPQIENAIEPGIEVVMLANPGQPVECCLSLAALRHIARRCAKVGAPLAIDEAYHGFGAPSALPLVEEFDNVVVLRTFSKAFGAAGIRLGYAVGSERAIRPLNAVRQSGEVSSLSMAVATVLMDRYDEFVVPSIQAICAARDELRRDLIDFGLMAWGSFANYLLVDFQHPAIARRVADALGGKGVLVRVAPAPLDRFVMVTCGAPDLMRGFFSELMQASWRT